MKNNEKWMKIKHISLICVAVIILFIIFVSIVASMSDENRLEYKLGEDEFGAYYIVTDIKNTYRGGWFCKDSLTIPSTHKGLPVKKIEKVSSNEIKEIIIPDNVTHILSSAFANNISIQTIVLPDSLSSIGSNAFSGCKKLESITIPDSVTSIGSNAFSGCKKLESITIPDSVTSIGEYAFSGCSGLTSIIIPDSVTSIGSYAFWNCYKIVEVYNKSSLTITAGSTDNGYIAYYAKAVYTEPYISKLSTDDNGYVIYTDGDNKILVAYIGAETELILPSDITQINQFAFYDCSSLTSITIPDSVTSIGNNAFSDCKDLKNIIFADTMTWYRTTNFSNWEEKFNGTETIVTDSSTNATDFKDIYKDYYWYKL